MNLSKTRAKILSHAFLQADAPAVAIAKECGSTEKTVRNTLYLLRERNVINAFPLVNIHALGLTDYCIYFSLAFDEAKNRREVFNFLASSSQVAWLAELSGEFHFTVSVIAKDIFEVYRFFQSLSTKVCGISITKNLALRVNWTSFRCKYFGNDPSAVNKISRTEPRAIVKIDELDRKILQMLTSYPHESYTAIARRLKVATNTLISRIKILKKQGVLLGSIYYFDAHKVGMYAFRILFYAKNSNPKLCKKLANFCFKHKNISAFIECIGNWDFELNVELKDPAGINNINQELYEKFAAEIAILKTVSLIQTIKTAPYPFLKVL